MNWLHRKRRGNGLTMLLSLLVMVAAIATVAAQTSKKASWTQILKGALDRPIAEANATAIDADGSFTIVGGAYTDANSSAMSVITSKYSVSGVLQWSQAYAGTGNGGYANAVAVDTQSNIYVVGTILNSIGGADFLTLKYDKNGSLLWARTYDTGSSEVAGAVAIDRKGNIDVAGVTYSGLLTGIDFLTVQYDPNGKLRWAHTYDNLFQTDVVVGMAVDTKSNVYVVGSTSFFNGVKRLSRFLTVAYKKNGQLAWSDTVDAGSAGEVRPVACATDAADHLLITGTAPALTGRHTDFLTLQYTRKGALVWQARLHDPSGNDNKAQALATDAQNNVYVAGYTGNSFSAWAYSVLKYAPTGNLVWTTTKPSLYANGYAIPAALVVDARQNVVVTGLDVNGDTGGDGQAYQSSLVTVGLDAGGKLVWENDYPSQTTGKDQTGDSNPPFVFGKQVVGLTVDGAGNVGVGGNSSYYDPISGFTEAMVALGFNASAAPPTARTLTPTDDTYVRAGDYADTPYGNDSILVVKKNTSDSTSIYNRCSYLKFDLRDIKQAPASATLTLTVDASSNPAGASSLVRIYAVDDTSWDGSMTWNTAPGLNRDNFTSAGAFVTSTAVPLTAGTVTFDLTSFVAGHLGQVVTLQLIDEDTTSLYLVFESSAADSGSPQLQINF